MLKEERNLLWLFAAVLIGMSLPLILLGRAVMFSSLCIGIIFGLIATRGTSIRQSVHMLLSAKLVWLFATLFAAFALSSFFAINPTRSWEQTLQVFWVALGSVGLFIAVREMPGRYVQTVLQTLCITTFVVMGLSLWDAFSDYFRLAHVLHGDKWESVHRLNYMSSTFAILTPFIWAWLLVNYRENNTAARTLALPFAILLFLTIFACGGRAGWVAGVLGCAVFIYAAVKYHHFTLRKKDWALGLIVLTLAPFMYGLSRGFEQLYSRMDLANEDLGPASGRLQIWEFVLNHLWINPITGVGLGNFRVVPGSDSTPSNMHPHNFVLQLMLETGLIGSLIAAAITLYLLWLFRGYARGNIYGAAGLAAAVAFFTSSLANTSIFNAWWLMFIVVPCIIGWRVGWSAAVAPKQPTTFVRDDRPILRGRLGLSDSL